MARPKTALIDPMPPPTEIRQEQRFLDEVSAVASITVAIFTFLSLISYQSGAPTESLTGRVGYQLASIVRQGLGFAGYFLPLGMGMLAWRIFRHTTSVWTWERGVALGFFLINAAVVLALALPEPNWPLTRSGGLIGGFLAALLRQAFGTEGSYLLSLSVFLLTSTFLARLTLRDLAQRTGEGMSGAAARFKKLKDIHPLEKLPSLDVVIGRKPANVIRNVPSGDDGPLIVLSDEVDSPAPTWTPRAKKRKTDATQQELRFDPNADYQMPPISYLDPAVRIGMRIDEDALRKSSQILEAKLADFGIEVKVVEVRPGPVITTYEVEPAPGVRVSRIVGLADELSMYLRVNGVRILAPVPGKAVVGIEVANARREEVRLREMVENDLFKQAPSTLTMALGKDTSGAPVMADLAKMPHFLVAGATGSGKSVALNAMIVSILYKAPPRDVRFVMIDMKMLELSVYENIPHLLVPVVTDPKKAVVALKNLVELMDDRYRIMKGCGVRNIDGYNRWLEENPGKSSSGVIELEDVVDGASAPAAKPLEYLPKIVVIIDELADLMMTMGRHVEDPITRLAQKARAAGIHLILATQRPSVDVITGLIKANFPARVSFQVTTRIDSRTILDSMGAERLLGGGDMLYMPAGTARLQRLHGPLVTETEIHRIVEFVRKQGAPQYAMDLLVNPEGDDDESSGGDDELSDALYDQAVELVTETRQASISWVQRKLRVGYNRAARMIERMERDGVVTTSDNGRPREVIAQRIPRDAE